MSTSCPRTPLNVNDRFHVNSEECVVCETCSGISSEIFAHDSEGISYVKKSPEGDERLLHLFNKAQMECPSEAIHDR